MPHGKRLGKEVGGNKLDDKNIAVEERELYEEQTELSGY